MRHKARVKRKILLVLGISTLVLVSILVVGWSVLLPRVLIPRAIGRIERNLGSLLQGSVSIRGVNYSPIEGITIREIHVDSSLVQGSFHDLFAQPNLGFLLGISPVPVEAAVVGYFDLQFDGSHLRQLFSSSEVSVRTPHQEILDPGNQIREHVDEPAQGSSPVTRLRSPASYIPEILEELETFIDQVFPLMPRQFRISSGDLRLNSKDDFLSGSLDYFLWTRNNQSWFSHGSIRSELGQMELSAASGLGRGLGEGTFRLNSLKILSLPSWLPVPPQIALLPQGVINLELHVFVEDPGFYRLGGAIALTEAVLDWPVFASEPVQIPHINYAFSGILDLLSPVPLPELIPSQDPPRFGPGGLLFIESGELGFGNLQAQFTPSILGFLQEPIRITFGLQVPSTPIQTIIQESPEIIRRGFSGMEIDGTFGWDFYLEMPLDRIGHMQWSSIPLLDNFSIRSFPLRMSPFDLNNGFPYRFFTRPNAPDYLLNVAPRRELNVAFLSALAEQTPLRIQRRVEQLDSQVQIPELLFGLPHPRMAPLRNTPGQGAIESQSSYEPIGNSYNQLPFIPLEDMSTYVIKAVLTGEDGDFFFHPGFNWNTLRSAVERNIRSGQVQFGASTISMQLVKNLFLDDSRELVRKLQEAFLVYLMEHRSGIYKDRILELYLNIAPFGPTTPGIHGGAQYFFQKDPRDLNLLESVWLATMLPSPFRFSSYIVNGAPAPFWLPRMQFFLDVMLERGRITEEEHLLAIPAHLRFHANFDPSLDALVNGDQDLEEESIDFDTFLENDP